jgi:type IV secretion system protein VirB6
MSRRALILAGAVVILAVSPAARAQTGGYTTAQLRALATADAQKYGVPPQMFLDQIQGESSWNPNIGCNKIGACGMGQFLPATAASMGVDVNDPVSSLDGAARYDAQLQQQYGSWSSALTHYSGGLTSGNTQGNAAYQQAFDAAQAADSGSAAVNTAGDGMIGIPSYATSSASPAISTATATSFSGTTFAPFCWLWNEYQSAVATPLSNQVGYVQQQAAGQVTGLLIVGIMIAGYLLFYANLSMREAWSKMFRAVFIIPLVTGADTYNSWVVAPVNGLVGWLAQGLGVASNTSCPASAFDGVLLSYGSHVETAWQHTPSSIGYMILIGLMIVGSALVIGLALAVLYAVWLVAQALLEIVLIEGPILLLGLLFEYTRRLFDSWVGALILLVLVVFSADMLSALFVGVINAALGAVAPTNSALADGFNLAAVALVVVVLAAALVILPRLLEHMAGAVGAPAMSGMQQALGRVGAAVRGVPRAVGRLTRPGVT